MSKLRLGVIGAGSWTVVSHLPNIAKRADEVELVGVCRKGKDLLAKIGDEWGFRVASEDYRDVLDAGADIVIVGSPTAFHYEHALAALDTGAHVLVEKPFTMTSQEAWHLVDVAAARSLHLVVSYGFNYRPLMLEAERLMNEVGIGTVEAQTVYMGSVTRDLLAAKGSYPLASPEAVPESQTWTDPATSGGGYGQAQLTHALGAALRLSGLVGETVFAMMSAPHDEPVEIYDAMAVRYAGGAIGTVGGASCHEGGRNNRDQLHIRLVGDDGQLDVEFESDALNLFHRSQGEFRPQLEPGAGRYDCDGPVHVLVDLARGADVENRSPGELGARTVEVLEAAYRSAAEGVPVRVEARPA